MRVLVTLAVLVSLVLADGDGPQPRGVGHQPRGAGRVSLVLADSEGPQPRLDGSQPQPQPRLDNEPQPRDTTAECSQTYDLTGTNVNDAILVQSPGYPGNYGSREKCKYNLKVPANRDVWFDIDTFDVRGFGNSCRQDFLRLKGGYNRRTKWTWKICGQYYANTEWALSALKKDYTLKLTFKSNKRNNGAGFSIRFYLAPNGDGGNTTTTSGTTPSASTTTSGTTTTVSTTTTSGTTTTTTDSTTTSGNTTTASTTTSGTTTTANTTTTTTATAAPGTCQCGIKLPDDRIVGGEEAIEHEFPWQVVVYPDGYLCGGTLIDPLHVLTAAHCTVGITADKIRVGVGLHSRQTSNGEINVEKKTEHPAYDDTTLDNDYSILKLSQKVTFDHTKNAACVPKDNADYDGKDLVVSGWGTTSEGGSTSDTLQKVTVKGVTNAVCTEAYNDITENMLCAGDENGGKDSCQGDSGGPLTITENGRTSVVGVVSWGTGCGRKHYYGVYSNVGVKSTWIYENSNAGDCNN